MFKKRLIGAILAVCMVFGLASCGNASSSSGSGSSAGSGSGSGTASDETKEHEEITMMYFQTGCQQFVDLVKEKYPEINLRIVPYGGQNYDYYTKSQLMSGVMPDIYITSNNWDDCTEYMEKNLVDMSGFSFTDRYIPTQLRDASVDGKLYLLPVAYRVQNMSYNKTLFEKHGWAVPTSYDELKALIPSIKEAGCNVAKTNYMSDNNGMYFLSSFATIFGLNGVEGKKWQKRFLNGEVSCEEGFGEALDYMKQWADDGIMEGPASMWTTFDFAPQSTFMEGNTALYIGYLSSSTQNADGTGDQYAPIPFLSQDGSNNMYVTQVHQYYGISKKASENKQKFEDIKKVFDVLSTIEGEKAMLGTRAVFTTLKGEKMADDPLYDSVYDMINDGYSAPRLGGTWTKLTNRIGYAAFKYIEGQMSREDTIAMIDEQVTNMLNNPPKVYAHCDEAIGAADLAYLAGHAAIEDVNSLIKDETKKIELALISYEIDYGPNRYYNQSGTCGQLLPGDVTKDALKVFAPFAYNGSLVSYKIPGSKIKEIIAGGIDGHFPLIPVGIAETDIEDERDYTVVMCSLSNEILNNLSDYEDTLVNYYISPEDALAYYFETREFNAHFTVKDIPKN